MHDRDLGRHDREVDAQQLDRAGGVLVHAGDHARQRVAQHGQHVAVVAMNPSSASSETYSARWRTVSCGSARNTGPTS